jgi:hypothetical protein
MSAENKFPVSLTEAETLLVGTIATVPPSLAQLLSAPASPRPELLLAMDEIGDLVERLRDEVVFSGFDANYALNERGRILEGLADRLFSHFLMSGPDQS